MIVSSPPLKKAEIRNLFDRQKGHQLHMGRTTAAERIARLRKLKKAVLQNRAAIREALYQDLRKHPSETDMTEIYPVTSEIKFATSRPESYCRLVSARHFDRGIYQQVVPGPST